MLCVHICQLKYQLHPSCLCPALFSLSFSLVPSGRRSSAPQCRQAVSGQGFGKYDTGQDRTGLYVECKYIAAASLAENSQHWTDKPTVTMAQLVWLNSTHGFSAHSYTSFPACMCFFLCISCVLNAFIPFKRSIIKDVVLMNNLPLINIHIWSVCLACLPWALGWGE